MEKIFIVFLFSYFAAILPCGAVEKLVIIGGGPAGLTAAIFASQFNFHPLVIEGEKNEAQYPAVFRLENFPGFPEGISGQELNDKLTQQALAFGARFYAGSVLKVDLQSKPFLITLSDGRSIQSNAIIVATGASPRWLDLPSEQALIGKGVKQ